MINLGFGIQYIVRGTGRANATAAGGITACAGNINSVCCIRQIAARGQMIYLGR